MIYNTISIKYFLSKIYRDLKPSYTNWEADVIEWAGEALSFIGANQGFITKEFTLNVKNHRTPLPNGFYTLLHVFYEDKKLPYGKASSSVNDDAVYISAKTEVLENNNFQMTRYGSRLYNPHNSEYYILNPNYIQTSFETGTIDVICEVWDTDEEGLPKIPDSPYYMEALQWYILRQFSLGGNKHPNPEFTFTFLDYRWEKACAAAQNDAMYPSEDKVRKFNDMWVNFIAPVEYNEEKPIT